MRVGFGVGISYINAPILSGYIDKEEEHEAWLWEDDSYMLWNNNEQVIISYKEEQEAMIESIKQAMVLWYDIKRQGCTNENMAANPVLKDLSGNGHDATCYNFAWSGMSSVGGEDIPFSQWEMPIDPTRAEGTVNGRIINYTKMNTTTNAVSYKKPVSYKCKYRVTGVSKEQPIAFGFDGANIHLVECYEDGIYEVDWTNPNGYYKCIIPMFIGECNITVEQLPIYPNALVSDGVDDYVGVSELPIMTDYTIIVDRRILSMADGAVCTKTNSSETVGSFVFERPIYNYVDSYCLHNLKSINLDREISYQSKAGYNGNTINFGQTTDFDKMNLYSLHADSGNYCLSAAIYSLLLFNRTLTNTEIEWVKSNLIEGDYEL